jgi:hypothetical protein
MGSVFLQQLTGVRRELEGEGSLVGARRASVISDTLTNFGLVPANRHGPVHDEGKA